ncbi:MAG: hypothetical protein ABFS56_35445 [Pseudomonadota bacterium]
MTGSPERLKVITLRQKAKQIAELGKNFGISIHLTSYDPCHIGIRFSGLPRASIDIYCVQRFRFGRMSVISKKINKPNLSQILTEFMMI